MIKTFTFSIFGVEYRTKQFAAIPALAVMNDKDTPPEVILSQTEARSSSGDWVLLNSKEAINKMVVDKAEAIPPRMALDGLTQIVGDRSFGFIRSWRGAKVPRRFLSSAQTIDSGNVDPIILALTTDKMATVRELEEYYSLEDAFKMFDSMVVKGINSALSTEAAMAK